MLSNFFSFPLLHVTRLRLSRVVIPSDCDLFLMGGSLRCCLASLSCLSACFPLDVHSNCPTRKLFLSGDPP